MPASVDHRIGDLAVERGLITPDQLSEALAEQKQLSTAGTHTRLGQILVRRKALTIDQLMALLKTQTRSETVPVPALAQKYRVVQELGSGSAGMVYLAEDVQLGRPVALKVLRPDSTMSRTGVKRFLAEGKALAKLRHPAIVQVYEIGHVDETYFIAMEYVPGETLERYMTRGRVHAKEAATIVAEVADAVEHAHAQGIIHRDIKPQNVMVEMAGSDRRVRIMDFGLAHDIFAATRLTATGAVIGTPMYMAPEQVSAGPIDVRTDVYALGAILYELLTNQSPFTGRTTYELYEAIVAQDPVAPRKLNARVPPELEMVTLCALNKVPAYRYPTAAAMAADLRRYLRGEPVTAKGLSFTRRLLTKARRHRVPLGGAALLLLAAGILAVLVVKSARQEREFARLLEIVDGHLRTQDFLEASRQLGQAAVLRPGDDRLKPRRDAVARLVEDAVSRAEGKMRDGLTREAADLMRRALAAAPDDARATACLKRAEEALQAQTLGQREIAERLDHARKKIMDCQSFHTLPPNLYSEKKLEGKLQEAREALAGNLKLGDGLDGTSRALTETLLGRVELLAGRPEAAIEAFGRAIAIEPSGAAHYGRGEAHMARYHRERTLLSARESDLPEVYRSKLNEIRMAAAADFTKARELKYGTDWEEKYLQALILRAEGRLDEANDRLQAFGETDRVEVWMLRGEVLNAWGRYAEACVAYEYASNIARSDYEAAMALANARIQNAHYGVKGASEIVPQLDKAVAALDVAIKLRPSLGHLYVIRGKARFFKIERLHFLQRFDVDEDMVLSLRDYEKAIEMDEKDDRAHAGRGIVLMSIASNALFREGGFKRAEQIAGDFQAAADVIKRATDLNPWEWWYYKDRGLALSMKGLCLMLVNKDAQPSLDEAFQLIQRTVENDSNSPSSHEAMALAHLWQSTVNIQKMKNPRPHLEAAIDSCTTAMKGAGNFERGRTQGFRSILRMMLAFYLFFSGSRREAADLFDAGAKDMDEAKERDPMLAMYDPAPIHEFSRVLRLNLEGKDTRQAFLEVARQLGSMADVDVARGGGSFLAHVFGRSMRGFAYLYAEKYQEAVDEWTSLKKLFPPLAFVLDGWISTAKKKMKPKDGKP